MREWRVWCLNCHAEGEVGSEEIAEALAEWHANKENHATRVERAD